MRAGVVQEGVVFLWGTLVVTSSWLFSGSMGGVTCSSGGLVRGRPWHARPTGQGQATKPVSEDWRCMASASARSRGKCVCENMSVRCENRDERDGWREDSRGGGERERRMVRRSGRWWWWGRWGAVVGSESEGQWRGDGIR